MEARFSQIVSRASIHAFFRRNSPRITSRLYVCFSLLLYLFLFGLSSSVRVSPISSSVVRVRLSFVYKAFALFVETIFYLGPACLCFHWFALENHYSTAYSTVSRTFLSLLPYVIVLIILSVSCAWTSLSRCCFFLFSVAMSRKASAFLIFSFTTIRGIFSAYFICWSIYI